VFPKAQVAAQAVTLSLDEAVERALNTSIRLQRSAVDLGLAGYSAQRLWSEIFPNFSLRAGFNFLPATPLFTEPGFSFEGERQTYSVNVGVLLSLNPSLRASMNRIELAYRSQLLSYEDARRQLEISVIKNYLRLVTMKANITYMEESLEFSLHTLENSGVAWRTGHLSELTWLNAQLSVETARYDLNAARGAYQTALWEFLALLGMDANIELTFSGGVDIVELNLDGEKLILEHLPRRPDLVAQRQNIERLELTKNITTLNSRAPTLELSTQWGTPAAGVRPADPFADRLSASVTLTIPVDSWIPGTRQNQTLRAADAEIEKAALELQSTEVNAKTEIRSLISNLGNTWESLRIARLRTELAQRTVEAANEAFRNGRVSFQELEDRRRDLSDSRQRLLQGELNYQNMLLDLAAALNVEWKNLIRGEL
jgi:multidrug efflux system outer membrane protein